MYLPGGFILPIPSRLERPVELYSAGTGAVINTAAAIPAFFRMQDYRRFTLLRVRNINVYLAHFNAVITAIAFIREKYRVIRCGNVGHGFYFILSHILGIKV